MVTKANIKELDSCLVHSTLEVCIGSDWTFLIRELAFC